MAGTLTWSQLDDDDPAKIAALYDAARHHALRVDTAQTALAEASHAIAGAADWAVIPETSSGATRLAYRAGGPTLPDIPYGRDYDEDGNAVPPLDERPLFPPPTAPLDVARRLYSEHREHCARTLLCWRGGLMRWHVTHWSEMDAAELRSRIYEVLGHSRAIVELPPNTPEHRRTLPSWPVSRFRRERRIPV